MDLAIGKEERRVVDMVAPAGIKDFQTDHVWLDGVSHWENLQREACLSRKVWVSHEKGAIRIGFGNPG